MILIFTSTLFEYAHHLVDIVYYRPRIEQLMVLHISISYVEVSKDYLQKALKGDPSTLTKA